MTEGRVLRRRVPEKVRARRGWTLLIGASCAFGCRSQGGEAPIEAGASDLGVQAAVSDLGAPGVADAADRAGFDAAPGDDAAPDLGDSSDRDAPPADAGDLTLAFEGKLLPGRAVAEVEVAIHGDRVGVVALQFDVADPSGRLVLRGPGERPPGVTVGVEAATAGKMVTTASLSGPATRVMIFGLNLEVIPDLDGDGVKRVTTLAFAVAPGAAPGPLPLQLSTVVVTDVRGRSNKPPGGIEAVVRQTPPQL
jgi:hypothetical protein